MSQNDYTGLENMTDGELVKECFNTFEDFLHRPLEMELAKRLDRAIDNEQLLKEWDGVDLSVEDAKDLHANLIECVEQTVALLKVLGEFDVVNVEYLRAVLQGAKIINEAA